MSVMPSRRLWRRYLVTNTVFSAMVAAEMFRPVQRVAVSPHAPTPANGRSGDVPSEVKGDQKGR